MESALALLRLPDPNHPSFLAFLSSNLPFGLRLRGTVEESGGTEPIWIDNPVAPRIALHIRRGWIAPVGETAFILSRLDEMEAMTEESEGDEDLLKFSSLPIDAKKAVAAKRRLVRENPVGMYTLRKEDFIPSREGPPVESLHEEDAPVLAANSPYEEGAAYASDCIRRAPNSAVRIEGELASYMLTHRNGSIGMLYTVEKFRDRGLGRLVVSSLVEKQFERGRAVYCYIVEGNTPSEQIFTSLGFEKAADVYWIAFERSAKSRKNRDRKL